MNTFHFKGNHIPIRLAPVTNHIVLKCLLTCYARAGKGDIKRQHRGEYIETFADSKCSEKPDSESSSVHG